MPFRNVLGGVLLTALILSGCRSSRTATSESAPVRDALLPHVVGHGFAVRRHETAAPLERVHEVLDAYPIVRLTDAEWERYGIEIIRVRESDLGAMLDRLPTEITPGMVWHGQALTWRSLEPTPVSLDGRSLVVDGQRESLVLARAGLVGRGWSIMTLDGPRILLQVVPVAEGPDLEKDQFGYLQREFEVGPGDLLIIAAGSGQWPHPPPEDTSAQAEDRAAAEGTLGQLLLERDADQGRLGRLLIITPRFDD